MAKTKDEVLYVGDPHRTLERLLVTGSRLDANDPIAAEFPERVVPAPPRDGTAVVVVAWAVTGLLGGETTLTRGEILTAADGEKLGHLCVPGPVNPDYLGPLWEAAAYNEPGAVAKRLREHEEGVRRVREHREAAARQAEAEAAAAAERAHLLRAAVG